MIQRLEARNAEKETLLTAAVGDLAKAEQNERAIRDMLGVTPATGQPAAALDDAYARAMLIIREQAAPQLVAILSLTVGNRQLDAKGVGMRELAEPVTIAATLRKIRIRLKGRYESLADLQRYLDRIREAPAVIKSIDIVNDQFDTEILVMGV